MCIRRLFRHICDSGVAVESDFGLHFDYTVFDEFFFVDVEVEFFVYRLGALFTSAYGFGTADAVVIAIVAAAVVAAVVYIVLQKRKGKCIGCSGACVSCSECPAVHKCTRSATEKYERTLEYTLVKKEKPCYNTEKQSVTLETTDAETTGGEHNSEPQ